MTPFALSLVLTAALLHALWNALIKGSSDRAFTMGLINLGHGLLGIALVLAFLPPARESWPFIAGSTLIHFFYYGFLVVAYRHGDLSQVYPVARGVAPILVALGAQAFAGEVLSWSAWAGIWMVSGGIVFLLFARSHVQASGKAVAAALMTGVTIAAYSVVDGLGVRVSVNAFGYIGWLFLLECLAGFAFLTLRRSVLTSMPARAWVAGIGGGLISALAYGLAIYAQKIATMGSVSAVRESSVIIAALIGVLWFGERPWKGRLVAAVIVAAGVIVLAASH